MVRLIQVPRRECSRGVVPRKECSATAHPGIYGSTLHLNEGSYVANRLRHLLDARSHPTSKHEPLTRCVRRVSNTLMPRRHINLPQDSDFPE